MRIYSLLTTAIVLSTTAVEGGEPVSEAQSWTETFPVAAVDPQLVIDNIWGNVRVRVGQEGEIVVSADERRIAPNRTLFDKSREVLGIEIDADRDGVSIVVGAGRERQWHRDPCRGCRLDVQFEVSVPPGTRVDVETVTDGRIDVEGVTGIVTAGNVNGPIEVRDLHNCNSITSVNGAVDLSFAVAPGADCGIETINGDVTVDVPDGTGLNVSMDLFNGRMVSELNVNPITLPARVERSQDDGVYRYRIEQAAGMRLGPGGPTFSISSINGDVRIQKRQ